MCEEAWFHSKYMDIIYEKSIKKELKKPVCYIHELNECCSSNEGNEKIRVSWFEECAKRAEFYVHRTDR